MNDIWKLVVAVVLGVIAALVTERMIPIRVSNVYQARGAGTVPANAIPCPASGVCTIKVEPSIADEACVIKVPDPPFVHKGQEVRWEITPFQTEKIEFKKRQGIRIDGNKTAGGQKYFKDCDRGADSLTWSCVRRRGNSGGPEDEVRVFSYTIFLEWGDANDKKPCFVDPLIVSRD